MLIQRKAALISLLVSFAVLGLKVFAYQQTRSTGILSDALETTVNVMTALIAVIVLRYALAPADQEHPYGHGKLEYFSAAFEGGIILFAALAIIFESVKSLFVERTLSNLDSGIVYVIIAAFINGVAGGYLLKVGRQSKSEALKASGAHLMSDVKTTVGVVLGLLVYKITNLIWVDSIIGVLVGAWLLHEALQILKKNVGGLLDELDVDIAKELCLKMSKHLEPAIIDIHNLRVIRSGNFHHVDAHVVVPEYYDIKTIHDIINRFERGVFHDYSFEGELIFHTDPCGSKYCDVCMMENCAIRVKPFVKRDLLDYRKVISGPHRL